MITKKQITNPEHNVLVNIDKTNIYKDDLSEYEKLYHKFVKQGMLISSSFQDSHWIVVDKYLTRRNLHFTSQQFSHALKAYLLIKLDVEASVNNLQANITMLHKAIRLSNGFDKNYLESFSEEVGLLKFQERTRLSLQVINFLDFINHPYKEQFENSVKPFIKYRFNNRNLPPYKDVLFFDEVMQDFINTSSREKKLKYYPVVLWWKLTTVLPLRPREFCLLKYNCISQDENKYLITVPRKKQKYESFSDIDIEDTFEINPEVFNLIKYYQSHTKERRSQFHHLFTYETYATFHKNARPKQYTRNPNLFLNSSFELILNHFYKHVVKKKYNNKNIKQIAPGDTRHFAICNMMLQGFNMLSIAKLAGHRRLRAQRNYWNHIDFFVQSYVYVLSENNRMNKMDTKSSFSLIDTLKKTRIYEKEDFKELQKVDYGYCMDSSFPFNCTECAHCEFFYFHPEDYNKGITWLTEQSNNLDIRINENISYLKSLFENIKTKIHPKTGSYSLVDQEEINSTTTTIKHLSNKKALIDAAIPSSIGEDNDE